MFSLSSTRIRLPISRRSEGVRRRRIKTACGCSNESTGLESRLASRGGDVVACVISLSAQATSYNCCRVKPYVKCLVHRRGGETRERQRADAAPLRQVGITRAFACICCRIPPVLRTRL